MNSKYVVFPGAQDVVVREESIDPPGPGEILCKADKSLISIGTELHCLHGTFDPGTNWADWVKYPFRPGYSMVGRVIAVGSGVHGFKEGDRVASYGFHQQYYRVPVDETGVPEGTGPYVLPDGISSEDGTWRSLAITCQNGVRRAQLELGEMVGVVGLGPLGQLVTRYLALAGARQIVAIDPVKGRVEFARLGGATHLLTVDVKDAVDSVRDITHGWMLDVVFDVTGSPTTLAPCVQLLRKLGRLVLLGDTPVPTQQPVGPGVVSNAISILGIHGFTLPDRVSPFAPWTAARMSDLFFDYLLSGKMHVSELTTHRYSPLQAPDVYRGLVKDRYGDVGAIFDWTLLD